MSLLALRMYVSERMNKTPVYPLTCISTMVNKAEYIRRYKKIHREKTGVDLSNQEAIDLFEKLTTLVSVIYRSIPKE